MQKKLRTIYINYNKIVTTKSIETNEIVDRNQKRKFWGQLMKEGNIWVSY